VKGRQTLGSDLEPDGFYQIQVWVDGLLMRSIGTLSARLVRSDGHLRQLVVPGQRLTGVVAEPISRQTSMRIVTWRRVRW